MESQPVGLHDKLINSDSEHFPVELLRERKQTVEKRSFLSCDLIRYIDGLSLCHNFARTICSNVF